jgi:hypothetical protein
MTPLRIGVCGAHGVGKTHYANALGHALGIPVLPELARKENIMGLEPAQHRDAQKKLIVSQIAQETATPEFVADRTVIDVLAYWHALFASTATREENQDYINKVKAHISSYTAIHYIPIRFELEDDGVRFVSKSFQQTLDDIIRLYLDLCVRNYVVVEYQYER